MASLLSDIADTTMGDPNAETMIDALREISASVSAHELPCYFEWAWGVDEKTGDPDRTTVVVEIPAYAEGRRDTLPIAGQVSLAIHIARLGDFVFHGFSLETPADVYEVFGRIDLSRGQRIADVTESPFEVLLELLDGSLQTLVLSRRKRRLLRGWGVQVSERWVRRASDGTLRGEILPREIEAVATGSMPFALLVEFGLNEDNDVVYSVSDAQGSRLLQDA